MGIAAYIVMAMLLQLPMALSLIGLAVVVQRTGQAAYLRTLDNREKQLAFVVQTVITQIGEIAGKLSTMQSDISVKQRLLEVSMDKLQSAQQDLQLSSVATAQQLLTVTQQLDTISRLLAEIAEPIAPSDKLG